MFHLNERFIEYFLICIYFMNGSSMNIMTMLRAFHATARHGGMTAGARSLGVSQPTISNHIHALESEFGVELFVHRGRRVELTEFGQSLLDITNRLFELESEARKLLLEAKGMIVGNLRVGAVGPYNVMPLLSAFHRHNPRIRVTMTVGDSTQVIDLIRNYQADIGVLVHNVNDPRMLSIPYRRQQLVIFAHSKHPLAQRSKLCLRDIEGAAMVVRELGSTTRTVFDQALKAAGVSVRPVMEIGSRESIREAVAEGIGLGVVSEAAFIADSRLRVLPIIDFNAATYAHIICLRERLNSRLISAFLEVVEQSRPA